MIIDSNKILLGVTREQLKRILVPALNHWNGPYACKGDKPRTPAEKEDEAHMLSEAAKLQDVIARFLGGGNGRS